MASAFIRNPSHPGECILDHGFQGTGVSHHRISLLQRHILCICPHWPQSHNKNASAQIHLQPGGASDGLHNAGNIFIHSRTRRNARSIIHVSASFSAEVLDYNLWSIVVLAEVYRDFPVFGYFHIIIQLNSSVRFAVEQIRTYQNDVKLIVSSC